MNVNRVSVKIAGAAVLASLSVVIQCLPPIFTTPWFMRIDLVAVPWIVCWLIFGFDAALSCMLISIPLVGVLGPFAGGWVGMTMKAIASIWMFLIPALFARKFGVEELLSKKHLYIVSALVAIAVRDIACIVLNLYFAIPIFFNMTPSQVIEFFSNPRFQSFIGLSLGLIGLTAYCVEVAFWNTIQGIIDAFTSLIIALVVAIRLPHIMRKR